MPYAGIPKHLAEWPELTHATATTGVPPRPPVSDGWPAHTSFSVRIPAIAGTLSLAQATRRFARLLSSVRLSLQGRAA